VVTGFGWIVDNFWSQSIGDIQTTIKLELSGIKAVSYSSTAYYVGLIIGAAFWSTSADFVSAFSELANIVILISASDRSKAGFQCNNTVGRYFRVYSGEYTELYWLQRSLDADWYCLWRECAG